MPTGQLACELRISAPAITQLTDRLIRKGLIERRAAADDRRCVIVGLSEQGRQLVDQFRQHRHEVFSRALAHLSRDEQTQIVESLVKVVAALENLEANVQAETRNGNSGLTGKKQKNQQGIRGKKSNENDCQ
jgi:DNA-binding MarR family transcriptional regulator